MLKKSFDASAHRGFTLIELMLVVAIIAILAAVAVPNFINYRQKSAVASAVATANSIRTALISSASSTIGSGFPESADLATWAQLVSVCNRHGVQLSETAELSGFQDVVHYVPLDSATDGRVDDFLLVLRVNGVPNAMTGAQIEISPRGIVKQTY